MANVSSTANRAKRSAQRAASGDKMEKLARAGYLTKGVVYAIIGVLAFQAAIGSGGQTSGSRGAIRQIAEQPFGQVLLILTAIGLLGYAVWRLIQAIKDPEGKGSDGEGIAKRVGYAISGAIYAFLAFYAASIVFGWSTGSSGGSDGGKEAWTAQLLAQPFGQWLVGLVGAIVIGVGVLPDLQGGEGEVHGPPEDGPDEPDRANVGGAGRAVRPLGAWGHLRHRRRLPHRGRHPVRSE